MDKKKIVFLLEADAIKLSKVLSKDFLEVEIYAISEGENRNHFSFLYEAMRNSLPTFSEKPVLAYFNPFTQGIEEHNCNVKLDKDTGEEFYDYTGPNSERPVGLITPDSAKIVDYEGKKWIKLKAKLWVKYNRQLIKNLLKAKSRKVSVEIEILKSYLDDEDIEVIEEFVLDGITILQYQPNTTIPIREGIAGAKLNLKTFADSSDFKSFKERMTSAYSNQSLEVNEEAKELKCAEKEKIDIDNSKEAAIMDEEWEKPTAEFYEWLREARNFKTASKENALVLEEGWETNADKNKYPHHSRKGDKLVVNRRGVIAAYSRGMAQKLFDDNPGARRHILKHFKELGLPTTEMFTEDKNIEEEIQMKLLDLDNKVIGETVKTLNNKFKEREEESKMFDTEKMALIRDYIKERHECDRNEGDCYVWVCDIGEEEVVCCIDGKYFKTKYSIEESEEEIKVFVDTDNLIEVEQVWRDREEKKIVYEDKEYTIEEFIGAYETIKEAFSKSEESNAELTASKEELSTKFTTLSEDYETLKASSGELEIKIKQYEEEAAEKELQEFKTCGCKMIDDEDYLDSEEDMSQKDALKAVVEQYCDEKKFESKEDMCNFVESELRKLVYAKAKKLKEAQKGKEEFNADLDREQVNAQDPQDCFGVLREYNNR